jgi:hypothetical protein
LLLIAGNLFFNHLAVAEGPVQSVVHMDAQYAADFSNDEVLMGASHDVFVGKVIRQIGNKERGLGPETQYEVAVIDNIKGDLKGMVTVNQEGGYKDGALYVMDDDTSAPSDESDYLLKPGNTYLLATRYSPEEDWYTLNPYPAARALISSDPSASSSALAARAEANDRVKTLGTAYKHEIVIDADIKHGNALNSYASVQAKKAEEMKAAKETPEALEPAPATSTATTTIEATSTASTSQDMSSSTPEEIIDQE